MQSFAAVLALAGAAAAAAIMPRQNSGSHCCFNVNVAGAVAGPLGELADGQLRVGPGYTGIQFCYYNSTSSIVDTLGRGCIVTPPTSQYQCDTGLTATTATSGITVASNGSIEHGGNAVWYECNSGAGYNIYANSPGAAGSQCSRVTLNAVGGNCSAPVFASSSSRPATSSSVVSTSSKAPNTTSSILSTSSRAANTTTTTTTVIVTSGRPVNSTSSVVATTSRPATTSSGSVVVVTSTVTSSRPASSSSAPASSSSASASSSKPATSSSSSIVVVTSTVTSSKPASSSSVPVSSSSAPVSSSKPASSSSSPASSSSAPASSSKPASSSSAPASSSSAPASSSRPATTTSAAPTTSTAVPTSSARPTTVITSTTALPGSVCVPVTVTAPASTVTVTVTPASATSSKAATSSSVAASSSSAPATSSKPATTSAAAVTTSSASAVSSSSARASSSSSAAPASSACPTGLGQNYQYPHLIVPVSPAHPTTAYGTQYFAGINSTFSTIFNFDVPASYAGHTCTLEFLLPQKSQLVTSDYTLSGTGVIGFEQLNGTATQATTFANQPAVGRNFGNFTITPGSSSIIASGPCAAGTTVSYELIARGNTSLYYFQDYNPSAIGLYIVEC